MTIPADSRIFDHPFNCREVDKGGKRRKEAEENEGFDVFPFSTIVSF